MQPEQPEQTHVLCLCSHIFLIQIKQENDCCCELFFGLPVHGFLPGTGQPEQGFHLLAHHWLDLQLLVGHQGDLAFSCKCCEKEKPLNATKKLEAKSWFPEKEIPTPNCPQPSWCDPGVQWWQAFWSAKGDPQLWMSCWGGRSVCWCAFIAPYLFPILNHSLSRPHLSLKTFVFQCDSCFCFDSGSNCKESKPPALHTLWTFQVRPSWTHWWPMSCAG